MEEADLNEKLVFPDKLLSQETSVCIDIVLPDSDYSCCFTKGYFRMMKGTGSLLKLGDKNEEDQTMMGWSKKLRYFSPQEILNLLCYPSWFKLPDDMTYKQMYSLLGNSLNPFVVKDLI